MRPPIRLQIALIVLAAVLLFLPAGCARRERGAGKSSAEPAAEAETAGEAAGERRPMQLTDAGRERRATTPAQGGSAEQAGDGAGSAARPDVGIDPRDDAFAANRLAATPRYPSDFVIGSLGTNGLSRLELAAREYARDFLTTLLESGEPAEDAFLEPAPGTRAVVGDLVAAGLSADRVRVGRPAALPGGETSVPYRVMGGETAAHGEVVLEMADGRWYTSDIQVITSSPGPVGQFDPARDSPRR